MLSTMSLTSILIDLQEKLKLILLKEVSFLYRYRILMEFVCSSIPMLMRLPKDLLVHRCLNLHSLTCLIILSMV
nr:MAG TPA: hypothetical protein [Caudoviricetes sp.]